MLYPRLSELVLSSFILCRIKEFLDGLGVCAYWHRLKHTVVSWDKEYQPIVVRVKADRVWDGAKRRKRVRIPSLMIDLISTVHC